MKSFQNSVWENKIFYIINSLCNYIIYYNFLWRNCWIINFCKKSKKSNKGNF